MFEALECGDIKALWIVASNPLATMPNAAQIRRALGRAEMVVVQDCYHPTETSSLAHVLLPAAMSLEVEGTMTNSERRISLLRQCLPPPGEARPDWEIATRFAALMGFEEQFSYTSSADIFEEHKRCCSNVHALQIDGLNYRRLKRHPVQWPCPNFRSHGVARRYRRKVFATPSGRARFHPLNYTPAKEVPSAEYPLILTTGRLAGHWHTRTKTGHVPKLNKACPTPFVAVHPEDGQRLGLTDGEQVRMISVRGSARSQLKLDPGIPRGTLFMPIHWGQSFDQLGCVNALTSGDADPISHQPELKYCAVRLEKEV